MAYSTQAPGDKQTHNQRQADIFNRKTEVFTAPLPEEIKQASACHPAFTGMSPSSEGRNSRHNMCHCVCRGWPELWMLCRIWDLIAGSWMWVVGQAA